MSEYGTAIDIETTKRHDFKDGEYLVSMSVGSERVLKVEVEDLENGNKWLGKFDSTCKNCFFLIIVRQAKRLIPDLRVCTSLENMYITPKIFGVSSAWSNI